LKISGYGLIGNHQLKRVLTTLELAGKKPEVFEAAFVEDAALILASRIKRDGYLEPRITVVIVLENGEQIQVQADDLLDNPLARTLRIKRVNFQVRKGLLYHYQQLEFSGLESITEKQARSYFVGTGTLLRLKGSRTYTPEKLEAGLSSLAEVIERQGYEEVKAQVTRLTRDDKTGTVTVSIKVAQGPKSIVHSVREDFIYSGKGNAKETRTEFPNVPYSKLWVQDLTQSLKTNLYHNGYPDAAVEIQTAEQKREAGQIQKDLVATVKSGPQIRIGEITFLTFLPFVLAPVLAPRQRPLVVGIRRLDCPP